ncbi:hypothetical protein BT63DRAFT_428589 [Microthyrium microscopicum]|uniref:Uncharacterized protein n=1 Tax=Microthyrium microscopicum TaxID=703497 RepID=A0A6A6U152_9PEZI|nr:hypothetical protein BT63DRAFT_428589 [Microthyrium microscopicum]
MICFALHPAVKFLRTHSHMLKIFGTLHLNPEVPFGLLANYTGTLLEYISIHFTTPLILSVPLLTFNWVLFRAKVPDTSDLEKSQAETMLAQRRSCGPTPPLHYLADP